MTRFLKLSALSLAACASLSQAALAATSSQAISCYSRHGISIDISYDVDTTTGEKSGFVLAFRTRGTTYQIAPEGAELSYGKISSNDGFTGRRIDFRALDRGGTGMVVGYVSILDNEDNSYSISRHERNNISLTVRNGSQEAVREHIICAASSI